MKVATVAILSLTPDLRNARTHDGRNIDAIAASLDKFGQRKPIVVTADKMVIAGNGTLEAARKLGWTEIVVAQAPEDWDDATIRAYALADNRSAELADWDESVLQAILDELALGGWNIEELGFELPHVEPEALIGDPDEVPETVVPKTVSGDVWLLGPHRLVCGDSTSPTDVEKLMKGARADMVWTDPPYGVDYIAMRGGKKIKNDASLDEAKAVMTDALTMRSSDTVFVCCNWKSMTITIDAMVDAGLEPKACIVWDKGSRVQNLDRFAKQHEFILYAGPYGGQPTVDVDVWQVKRDFDPDHPTPKPVELVMKAIESCTSTGQLVQDFFGGSGSTLIAAHQTNRIAYLMELDPHYCDVICARFQTLTGLLPIAESTGNKHDFLA